MTALHAVDAADSIDLDRFRDEGYVVVRGGMCSAEAATALRESVLARLVEAGIDSLASVDFTAKLSASLGTELPGSLVFDYPIAIALAGHLATLVASVGGEASSPLEAAAHPPHNTIQGRPPSR